MIVKMDVARGYAETNEMTGLVQAISDVLRDVTPQHFFPPCELPLDLQLEFSEEVLYDQSDLDWFREGVAIERLLERQGVAEVSEIDISEIDALRQSERARGEN